MDKSNSFKVPREDNQFLCVPARAQIDSMLESNLRHWNERTLPTFFAELRGMARRDAQRSAMQLEQRLSFGTSADTTSNDSLGPFNLHSNTPWIVGGHQPELFHPGVWFKNFLLHKLARDYSANPLHAIIDHDLAKTSSIRVPSLDRDLRRLHSVQISLPMQRASEYLPPWHLASFDFDELERFRNELKQNLASLAIDSFLGDRFVDEMKGLEKTNFDSATLLSIPRTRTERRNGIANAEMMMSMLCRYESWGRFVGYCLSRAPELVAAYNRSRDAYRAKYKMRNPVQPVPELQSDGDWLELPFWIYSDARPKRSRLWCRKSADHFLLSSSPNELNALQTRLSISNGAFEQEWAAVLEQGIYVQPRALMTTLYLRCFLSDLFIHGIGGGLYDEVTDELIRDFLGMEPPGFVVASATLHLPMQCDLPTQPQLQSDRSDTLRLLQLLRSCPERFLDRAQPDQEALFRIHQSLLDSIPPRGQRKVWHREMQTTKTAIELKVRATKTQTTEALGRIHHLQSESRLYLSREYSIALFSEHDVVSRLHSLSDLASRNAT